MKRIIILRHGDAVSPGKVEDHQRYLTDRGLAQATAVGESLKKRGLHPSATICSDALRTQQTYKQLIDSSGFTVDQEIFTRDFYLADTDAILSEMASISDDKESVLLVGHNPGWSHAVSVYSGEYLALATAQAAVLEIEDSSWMNALSREGQWRLVESFKS